MRGSVEHALEEPSLPALGDVFDLMRVIWAVDHAWETSSKRTEAKLGVTQSQRLVIRIVGRFPGITAGHLARLLHVHPGTLTGILKRLERQGFVSRRRDPRDGRRALIGLTEKGRLFDFETEEVVQATLQAIVDRTPPAKLRAAREVLESIAAGLSVTGV